LELQPFLEGTRPCGSLYEKILLEASKGRLFLFFPPVGGYTSHLSGTSAEFYSTDRPNVWMENFACPGTRKVHDWDPEPRQRKLLAFTAKGKPREVCNIDVEVDDSAVQWLTYEFRKGRYTEPTAGEEDEELPSSSSAASASATVLTARQKRARRAGRQRDTFRVYTNDFKKVFRDETIVSHSCDWIML